METRDLDGIRVLVAPMTYTTRVVDELKDDEGEQLLGQADPGQAELRIYAGQSFSSAICTLVHEAIHVLLEQSGHLHAACDEGLVRAITYGLMNISIDDRPLLAFGGGDK